MSGATTHGAGYGQRSFFQRFKWLVLFLALGLVLAVTGYFTVTSSPVLKALLLPPLQKAMGARITVDEIALSPFSQVRLKNLQVTTSGSQPVLSAAEVTVRYRFLSVVRGTYVVPEITVVRPVLNIEVAADGTSNLDPLLGSSEENPGAPTALPSLDLATVTVRDGALAYCQRTATGTSQCSTLTNLDLTLTGLKNGGTCKLVVAARLGQANRGASNQLDSLGARLKADLGASLTRQWLPTQITGILETEVQSATGNLAPAAGLSGRLTVELTPTELKDLALRFQREGATLGEIRVFGPLDPNRREGRLTFQIKDVGRAALALVGAPLGLDFGKTTLSGSGFLDLAERGTRYTANVTLGANQFAIAGTGGSTPPLDLQFELRGNVETTDQTAYLEHLLLSGKLEGRELFSARAERALNLSWNRGEPRPVSPALLSLAVNDLKLTDWRYLIGTNILDGVVSLDAQLTSEQDGREVAVTFATFPEFSTSSFKDPVALITRLQGATTPLSQYVSNHLSQVLYAGYDNYTDPRNSKNPQRRAEALRPVVQTLAHDFNKLAEKGGLYTTQRFANVNLRPVTRRALAANPNPTGAALQRLNRLLLEDAYPKEMARSIQVYDLGVVFGTNVTRDLGLVISGSLGLRDFSVCSLDRFQAECREAGEELFTAQASASYSTKDNSGNIELNLNGELPNLLARHPVPDIAVRRGTLRLSTLLNWTRSQYSTSLSALVGDASGTFGGYDLNGYSAQFDVSGELVGERFTLRRLGLTAREGTRSSGTAEMVGHLNSDVQTASFDLNVSGLNQFALRPFLPTSFGSVDLAGITIDSRGSFRYDARTRPSTIPGSLESFQELLDSIVQGRGETGLGLTTQVTNLVLRHRPTARNSSPLGFAMRLEGSRSGPVFSLGTNSLQWTPTPLAENLVSVSGRFDLSPTNPAPSTLAVRSGGLDLVAFVDLYNSFSGGTNVAPAPPAAAATAPAPETEPEALHLPLRHLTADLAISNVFARDIVLRDVSARAVLDQDRLTLAPVSLRVLEAPVTASLKLDLSRPGYTYEASLDAADVKLRPFVNTLAPAYLDQARGDLYARLRLSGAGVTGPSLQQHLQGEASLNLTNLTVHIITPRTRKLLTTLATALRIEDLAKSPLTLVAAQMRVADGTVAIQPFTAASEAFFATSEGTIRLAPVLTNSALSLPVNLALRQDLARQLKLTNLQPGPQTNYLSLPPFVKLTGTVGVPEAEIDKVRLAALLAGGIGGALGGTAGSAVQGVGSLLQGDTGAAVNTLGNLLQGRKPAATNTPAATGATNPPPPAVTRTNASTNTPVRSGVLNLLDALQKKP